MHDASTLARHPETNDAPVVEATNARGRAGSRPASTARVKIDAGEALQLSHRPADACGGARTEEELTAHLAAADLKLSAIELERIHTISAQPSPYPFWHHLNASARLSAAGHPAGRPPDPTT
jgi:hypothetical protein